MSNQEANEYMRNVKWSTAIYLFASTISIVLAIAGIYYGLKGDIKDNRIEAKEQIRFVFTALNSKMDSLQRINEDRYKEITTQISELPQPKNTTIIRHSQPSSHTRYFIEKYINGKLAFIPVD